MGAIYCGPYAGQVGDHEGYAERVLADGTRTAMWCAGQAVTVAHIAACACGWRSAGQHGPDEEADYEAVVEEWRREHLRPLIAEVADQGWAAWAERTAARAAAVARHVAAGELQLAIEVINRLDEDTDRWGRTLGALVEEQAERAAGGEDR